ncbi:IS3 family transposase, partial [Virgibacillus halophilus]
MSKSGYYHWRDRPQSKRKKRKKKLAAQVKRIFVESEKRYGSPKITRILNENGWNVSQKTV